MCLKSCWMLMSCPFSRDSDLTTSVVSPLVTLSSKPQNIKTPWATFEFQLNYSILTDFWIDLTILLSIKKILHHASSLMFMTWGSSSMLELLTASWVWDPLWSLLDSRLLVASLLIYSCRILSLLICFIVRASLSRSLVLWYYFLIISALLAMF